MSDLRDKMEALALQIADHLTDDDGEEAVPLGDKIDGLKTLTSYFVAMNGKGAGTKQNDWTKLQRQVHGEGDEE